MKDNYDTNTRVAVLDEDAEWQRVNTYVADVLKDCYVLFAKLSRLRGDFAGDELGKLDSIASNVRDIGQSLAAFSKAFSKGEYSMNKKEQYGDDSQDFDFSDGDEDFDFSEEEEEFKPEEEEEFKPEEEEDKEEEDKEDK